MNSLSRLYGHGDPFPIEIQTCDPEFFGYRLVAQGPRPKSTKCYKIELSGRAALTLHPLPSILLGPAHLNGVMYGRGQSICGGDGPKITEFFANESPLLEKIPERSLIFDKRFPAISFGYEQILSHVPASQAPRNRPPPRRRRAVDADRARL